ncbi:MAG: (2Fe-2S)-binding protein [Chloroflexota bacterium]|nr:MAG: (2Fe-2S)-binding protein [Chloroflexota bacterium]
MSSKTVIELKVNGLICEVAVEPQRTLLEVLRESLGYTGTKKGCDSGDCGACTVIIDGRAVLACLTLAVDVQGKDILTIEGLATGDELHPIQRAFVEEGAVQCGFCTPGLILSSKALLDENPRPTGEQVRKAIGGNLCRCTGYAKVIEAIKAAGKLMAEGAPARSERQ